MIGVFDSGSGGVTILEALHKQLPKQDFLYLGDHANAPYGHRSNQQIVDLTRKGVDALMQRGCTLVVLACNTAAAVALRSLQQTWLLDNYPDRRILGVLVPMVEAITEVPWSQEHPGSHKKRPLNVTLFATKKTIESNAYGEEIKKRANHINLTAKACPGLVDAIEGGAGYAPIAGLVSGYVSEILSSRPDAAVLGCTHFPLIKRHFEAALGDKIALYSQPEIVARALIDYLERHPEFTASPNETGRVTLLTSGDPKDVTAANQYLPPHLQTFIKLST
ncbi:glutamate racemase [Kordiimonas pumila]|uniref:Glutamate racemase n=1 Tax=Kordiimonas pumila TaxID=2161677 RepID=A0ABV7D649_9PROT|nr:glutamate racemase [Kordiimonas pumila]